MPNYIFAKAIVEKLAKAGHIAYFAGGWVRDFLMGHPSDDIDIATSASVEEIQKLFTKTIPVGIAFGIVIVVEEGHSFEVATFRKDLEYIDGRRPIGIAKASPEEDAKRRDFTINGMFYDPMKDEIIDYVQGKEAIKKKVVSAIGNPHDRFKEDRLRMMRAVRYATRFSFTIEEKTLDAIRAHANEILAAVAMERIWQEFKKMSKFDHFDRGLILLHELGLLGKIFPELAALSSQEIKKRCALIPLFPKEAPTIAELLELFPPRSREEIDTLCDYLKLSKEEKRFAHTLSHYHHLFSLPKEWEDQLEKIEWVFLYAEPEVDLILSIIALKQKDKERFLQTHKIRKQALHKWIVRNQTKKPILSAEDLIKEGISPGPYFGLLLKEAERISVNEDIEDKDALFTKLKQSPLWKH